MRVRVFIAVATCLFVAAPLLAQGPPEFSGPIVMRGEFDGADWDYWFAYTDWKRGYVAFHGVDIVSRCEGDPSGYNTWFYQDNFPPAEEGLIRELLKGDDITTSVWPVAIWADDTTPCEYIVNNPPLATGTVDIVSTDMHEFETYTPRHSWSRLIVVPDQSVGMIMRW